MDVLESFVLDLGERIMTEASRLVKKDGLRTLTARTIQTAVRLVCPHDIAEHATAEGMRAIGRFESTR